MNHQIRGFQTSNTIQIMANPTCPTSTWWRLMAPRKKSPKTMMTTRKSTLRPTAMLRCWLRVVSTLIAYWDPWLLEFPYVWTHPTLGSYTYSIYLYILHRTCMFNHFPPHWLTILIRRSFPSWHVYFKIPQMSHDVLRIIGHYPILSPHITVISISIHISHVFFKPIYGDDWGMVHYSG